MPGFGAKTDLVMTSVISDFEPATERGGYYEKT
jgi:hypothetical protein